MPFPTKYASGSATAGDAIAEIAPAFVFHRVVVINPSANGMQFRIDGGDWIEVPAGESVDYRLRGQRLEHQDTVATATADFRYLLSE